MNDAAEAIQRLIDTNEQRTEQLERHAAGNPTPVEAASITRLAHQQGGLRQALKAVEGITT